MKRKKVKKKGGWVSYWILKYRPREYNDKGIWMREREKARRKEEEDGEEKQQQQQQQQ